MSIRSALRPSSVVLIAAVASAQVSEPWNAEIEGTNPMPTEALGCAIAPNGDVVVTGVDMAADSGFDRNCMITSRFDRDGALLWTRIELEGTTPTPGRSVVIDPIDGAAYVAGSMPINLGQRVRVSKYDVAGTRVWTAWHDSGPGSPLTVVAPIQLDAARNVYVGENSASGFGYENFDWTIRSYDAAGIVRWTTTLDGTQGMGDVLSSICTTSSGDTYAVGTTNHMTFGASKMRIAKFDANGTVAWAKVLDPAGGGVPTQRLTRVACDAAGTAYACGDVSTTSGTVSSHIAAFDAAGNQLWLRSLPFGMVPGSIAVDAQGSPYVVGTFLTSDVITLKYDTLGNVVWQRIWDSVGGFVDKGLEIAIDAAGEITVGGETRASGSPQDYDMIALRYDSAGNLRWSHAVHAPGVQVDRLAAMAVGADGSVALAGSRKDYFGTLTGPSRAIVAELRPQSFAFCFGDGTGGPCPCSNTSPIGAQAGCTNSTGAAAHLSDGGIASLGSDTLVLTSSGETPSATTVLVQGTVAAAPAAFGDGLRCVGGPLRRMFMKSASAGVVAFPGAGDPAISARALALGDAIAAGSTRSYQAYYRDPNPAFCVAPQGSTWNMSSGRLITWEL